MMLISTLMVKKPILTDNFPKQHSLFFVCIDYAAHRNFERLWLLIRDKRISGSKDLEGKIWYIVYTTLKREGNGLKLFGKRWPTLLLKNLKKKNCMIWPFLRCRQQKQQFLRNDPWGKLREGRRQTGAAVYDNDNSDVVRRLQGPTISNQSDLMNSFSQNTNLARSRGPSVSNQSDLMKSFFSSKILATRSPVITWSRPRARGPSVFN